MISRLIALSSSSTQIPSNSRYSSSASDAYSVIGCLFFQISQNLYNGGAISLTGTSSNVSIDSSMFYYCQATSSSCDGGGFFVSCSDLTISRVCGVGCYAANQGQFLSTNSSITRTIALSVCQCSTSSNTGYDITNKFMFGTHSHRSLNSTLNYVQYQTSGFCTISASSTSAAMMNIINNSSEGIAVGAGLNPTYLLKDSNIVSNQCSGSNYGIVICYYAYATFSSCILSSNKGGSLFNLCSASSGMSVEGCFISHSGSIVQNGVVTTNCYISNTSPYGFSTSQINTANAVCVFPIEVSLTSHFTFASHNCRHLIADYSVFAFLLSP